MGLLTRVGGGFRGLLRKTGTERELDAELREFLEAGIEQKMRTGMSRAEAVRAARVELGSVEAVKHPQEGSGMITSLTETDGLAELGDDVTRIEPGTTVGFLSYASLVG